MPEYRNGTDHQSPSCMLRCHSESGPYDSPLSSNALLSEPSYSTVLVHERPVWHNGHYDDVRKVNVRLVI
eukprot:4898067-Amphidinium_carterae.1